MWTCELCIKLMNYSNCWGGGTDTSGSVYFYLFFCSSLHLLCCLSQHAGSGQSTSGPAMNKNSTDSSVLCLLQLQHPLSSRQVVHLLKRFNLGGNEYMLITVPVLMIDSRCCTSTWHESYENTCWTKTSECVQWNEDSRTERRARWMQTHSVTWSPGFYFMLEEVKAKEEESERKWLNWVKVSVFNIRIEENCQRKLNFIGQNRNNL